MPSLVERFRLMTAVVIVAVLWQLLRDEGHAIVPQEAWGAAVWPPSKDSAPLLFSVSLIFAVCVKLTFFSCKETEETALVRKSKQRLITAQMVQALKWEDGDKVIDDEEKEDTDQPIDKKKVEKRRPPSSKDLFEMLYDDIEGRHCTAFGIDAADERYTSVMSLFKERISEDLQHAVRYTRLARKTLSDATVDLDADDMKFCAQFVDGTKLTELIDLCESKVHKHFGKVFVPQDLLVQAKTAKKELLMTQRKGWSILLPMIKPLMPAYFVATILMAFDSCFGAMTWHGMATILDGVDAGAMQLSELRMLCLSNYVIFLFCIFSHLTARAIVCKVTSQFRLAVRSEVMRCMLRQDIAFFDIFASGILQERLNHDAEQLAAKFFDLPMTMVHMTFMLISNVYVVFTMKRELFFMIFVPLPIVSIAQYFIIKYMDKIEERQRKIAEHAAAGTMEVLKEIRTVREFAMEVEEADSFHANSSYRAGIEEHGHAMNHIIFIAPLVCMFVASRLSSTYLAGTYVAVKAMTVGQAIQVGFIGDHLQHVIRELMMLTPDIIKVMNPLGRICDMLASEPKIEPLPTDKPKLQPDSFKGHIVFRDVDFVYPSEPQKQILFQLSFEVRPGQRVAFVGGTGCGKSSTIKLIERFYSPQAGTIQLDGNEIADYDLYHLRRHMSVVAQDNMLFSTTLRENITYGLPRERRESIQDSEIEDACRKANAWGFINEFPRKLETYAGERGVKLSGGQKQRLAIARAIIREPTIILLDEATSALDGKAEAVVQAALDQMIEENKNGCTIMIAHRLTTIKRCDAIIVMEKGKIMEQGTHEQLLAIPVKKSSSGQTLTGWYHELWCSSMGNDDSQKMSDLERRVKIQQEEIKRLLQGPVKTRLGYGNEVAKQLKAPPTLLTLRRAASENVDDHKSAPAPPLLNLERAGSAVA
jgi:ABC-type multidrug transport system fused ATPase/permease subunit